MLKDMCGKVIGSVTVIKRVEDKISRTYSKTPQYLCRCKCGEESVIVGRYLRRITQKTRACGTCVPRMKNYIKSI